MYKSIINNNDKDMLKLKGKVAKSDKRMPRNTGLNNNEIGWWVGKNSNLS